jgi:hypothetical protein
LITRRTSQIGARFLLLDLVRQYANDRLSDEYDERAARAMHCDHFIRFGVAVDEQLRTPQRAKWLALADAEMPNLREALNWAQASSESERALRLAGSLATYWFVRDKREGRERLEAALALPNHDVRPATRAKALAGRALLGPSERGVTVDAAYASEGLRLYRELGDAGGEAACLGSLAFARFYGGLPDEARRLAGEAAACARRTGDDYCLAVALDVNAAVARSFAESRACAEKASAAFRRLGDERRSTTTLFYAVFHALMEGADAEANEIVKGVTSSALATVDPSSLPYVLASASAAALFNGESEVALVRLRDALEHCRETGQHHPLPEVLFMLAVAAAQRGCAESAARLLGSACAIRRDLPETAVHHRARKQFLDPCLRRLDQAQQAASEAAGRAMTPSEALDHGSVVARRLLTQAPEQVPHGG